MIKLTDDERAALEFEMGQLVARGAVMPIGTPEEWLRIAARAMRAYRFWKAVDERAKRTALGASE